MKDQTQHTREQIDRVLSALDDGDTQFIEERIGGLHPADLAEIIDRLEEKDRAEFFRRIPEALRAETLSEVSDDARPPLLVEVRGEELSAILSDLEVDDAADILAEMPEDKAQRVLDRIDLADSREITALMSYPEDSAGGVMTTEVVSVPQSLAADDAIRAVRQRGREVHDFYGVYVVDASGRLVGVISLQDLILSDGETLVETIMETDPIAVQPTLDQEEVARLFAKYNLVAVPVVDERDQLIGRITVDDIIDIIEAETTEDIFRLSGVDEQEETYATPAEIVRSRTPWLFITLITSGMGALIVAQFEDTIRQAAFVAVFMPVVAAMAGNSAVQATAVAVRRLALSSSPMRPWRTIARELAAGLIIGFVIALIIGSVAGVWREDATVALVVGGSMWVAISLGVLWGAAFPLLLNKLGLDPAVSSSVFLSTMTDMISFLLILGSASFFLTRWL